MKRFWALHQILKKLMHDELSIVIDGMNQPNTQVPRIFSPDQEDYTSSDSASYEFSSSYDSSSDE
jgi:hypothetical protein